MIESQLKKLGCLNWFLSKTLNLAKSYFYNTKSNTQESSSQKCLVIALNKFICSMLKALCTDNNNRIEINYPKNISNISSMFTKKQSRRVTLEYRIFLVAIVVRYMLAKQVAT